MDCAWNETYYTILIDLSECHRRNFALPVSLDEIKISSVTVGDELIIVPELESESLPKVGVKAYIPH